MFEGTYPAVATPFRDGAVDEETLRRLVRHLLDAGVDGLVACGTTGEAPTLTMAEWEQVVTVCVEESRGKPVIAGTGTNNTATAIAKTRRAATLGAAGALVVTPYYNKPGQRGLVAHFEAVAAEGGLPVVLYDVPSRTGTSLAVETVAHLSRREGIVGIKDAAGSMDRFAHLLERSEPGFVVLAGEDSLSYPLYTLGGHGVISTTATAAPALMAQMYSASRNGDFATARRLHFKLMPLFAALFVETNPTPLKYALHLLGFGTGDLRLPLVPVSEASRRQVHDALVRTGLLQERV